MNIADITVLVFAAFMIVVTVRLVETSRTTTAQPSRAAILARFNHKPARLWLSVALLALIDLLLFVLAFAAFGSADRSLFDFGARGWVMGLALLTTCALLSVVLVTVVRVYRGAR